ncbi:MAG: hypothetical protein ACE5JO_04515 [Candidatus Binatia bacterium]
MTKGKRKGEKWDHASLEWIHRARAQIYEAEKRRPLNEITPRLSPDAAAITQRLNLKRIPVADLPKRRRQTG